MTSYIYQNKEWPDFSWDDQRIINLLGDVRNLQGRLLGRMESLGFEYRNEAVLDTMTLDVIKSSEIEGVYLNQEQVRSSVARHLGIDIAGMVESDRNADGIVDIMIDATQNYKLPLTVERLFDWHSSLFPREGVASVKLRLPPGGLIQEARCKWYREPLEKKRFIFRLLRQILSRVKWKDSWSGLTEMTIQTLF